MISIIAALDEKRGIGKNGKLPWHISEDLKKFKQLTMGHPVIMGRKTFESIGRVLSERTNIVITGNPSMFSGMDLIVASSLENAVKIAKKSKGSSEIFIIGGGQIFKEAIEKGLVDRLYLTIVEGDFSADTFFPEYSMFNNVISEQNGEGNGQRFRFLVMEG